jgi:hypothetical protein
MCSISWASACLSWEAVSLYDQQLRRKGLDVVSEKIVFRVHAIQRMYQRSITAQEVHTVIQTGEAIEDYPNDVPYPSRLLLGWCGLRPIPSSSQTMHTKRKPSW